MKTQTQGDTSQKDALKHFRLSIIDAKLAYTLFKFLYQSRDIEFVGEDLFDKYFWVQKQHNIFVLIEHNAVSVFIVKILHGFDNDKRALTLKDIDSEAYEEFINEQKNIKLLAQLKILRDKNIAHHDKTQGHDKKLPPITDIDDFFVRLQNFYNHLCGKIENSVTYFKQDDDLKKDIEKMLQNLYIGEKNRILDNDIKWTWMENPKRISNKGNS